MAFDSLDIEIGGSVADAKAAIGSVKSSLFGLESSANDAQDSMEELGDETTQTTGRLAGLATTAGATATSMVGLSTAGTGASSSMAALGVSVGTATTAIVGLSAVAAPLAATLGTMTAAAGGLATAFGAIVGSGLLAFGEEQAEVMEDADSATEALAQTAAQLKQRLVPLIAEFGQRFIPLIQDAINGVVPLTRDILNAIGPLDQFREALRDMGGAAANVIPTIASELVGLGRRALPVLRDLIDATGSAIPQAFDAMVAVTERVGDDLLQLGSALVDLLPELTALGVAIIETVTPALTDLLDGLDIVLGVVTDLSSSINSDILPALATAGGVILALATGPVGTLAGAMLAVAANFETAKKIVTQTINDGFKPAFETLREAATDALTRLRVMLVGESGNGGLINQAIREAADFLSNNAPLIMRQAIKTLVAVAESVFRNLKIAVIGASGSGGILATMLTEAKQFFKTGGKALVKQGFALIGRALAFQANQIKETLTGGEDSILLSIIGAFVSYLKNDAVEDIKTALDILKDLMIAGAKGLARGFANGFGNISFQPLIESFNSVAETINGFIENINSQFGPINIGARVPTVSGDILSGGIDFGGGGSGGSGGSGGGIDFEIPGGDTGSGSDGSGGSGSDGDFDFGDGTDSGSGGSDDSEEEVSDDDPGFVNQSPYASAGEIGGEPIDAQGLLSFWDQNNLSSRLVEMFSPFGGDKSASALDHVNLSEQFIDQQLRRNNNLGFRAAIVDFLNKEGGVNNLERYALEAVNLFGSISRDDIPTARTGGLIESSGMLNVHAGERVVPAAQVADRGPAPVEVNMDSDAIVSELRQLRQSVESGDARVSDRDLVRGLERLFDRHGGTV